MRIDEGDLQFFVFNNLSNKEKKEMLEALEKANEVDFSEDLTLRVSTKAAELWVKKSRYEASPRLYLNGFRIEAETLRKYLNNEYNRK